MGGHLRQKNMKATATLLFCAFAATLCPCAEDDALVIAPRKSRIWFASQLKDEAFHKEAIEAARALAGASGSAGSKLDYKALSELQEGLQRDKKRTSSVFTGLLDARKTTDVGVRLGAVKALELATPDPALIGKPLAAAAVLETDTTVRGEAIRVIRSRKDAAASREMLKLWKSAFEDETVGVNEALRAAAEDAMRDVGDKRVYEVLYAYVLMELRAQSASLDKLDTTRIRNAGLNVNANDRGGNINLPIELPSLTLMSVETTLWVPALPSLQRVTGQNFGWNVKRWNEWLAEQPEFKK
jgi:uncharacterized protein with PIN domain